MKNLSLYVLSALLCAAPGVGAFTVGEGEASSAAVERIGPPTYYVQDVMRYYEHTEAERYYPIPQEPVTRETYYQWLEDSGHFHYADGDGPTRHGQYGPRHFMPVLAKYVKTSDPELGQACITMLKAYYQWLREEVERNGWHSQFIDEPVYIGLYRRYLSEGGLLDPDKDEWFKDLVLFMNRHIHVWGTPPTYWRGPMHRAQGEGIMKGLAALWYPAAPEAETWKTYADTVYQDFWEYKDNPPNDTGYYYGILMPLVLGAELRGDDEFFTHPGMQKIWERLMYEVSPDGAIIPYGAHGGWNSTVGARIYMLELAAKYTGDGRYRYAAHKLMNYLLYQQEAYKKHHILIGPETTEKIAVAYLLADDSIAPVQPDPGSRILYHKETLRMRNKEAAEQYLGPLDPAPDKNNICCSLLVTQETKPHKLVLRSGWNAGDFFVLVDLFPRHDPLNPGAILGMTRWGAALGMAMNAKGTATENRLMIEDLSGTAPLRFNTNPDLADRYYPEVEVPFFEDLNHATFATVVVTNYQGFPVKYTREFAFIKNRFLLTRDIPEFEEGFLAQVAPVYNTQNVGPQIGTHWANTFFSQLGAQNVTIKNPPYDLLVYFAPHRDCRMQVVDRVAKDPRAAQVPAQLRYLWRGLTEPGQKMVFTQVYYPHPPSLKMPTSNMPGAVRVEDLQGTAGAEGIHVLSDTVEMTVVKFTFAEGREEWVVCNPGGEQVATGGLATDARFAYVDVAGGEVKSVSAVEASFLSLDGNDVFRQAERQTIDK